MTAKDISSSILTLCPWDIKLFMTVILSNHKEVLLRKIFLNFKSVKVFDRMLSCHVRISEWIHTLYWLNVEALLTPCLKQAQHLKFKWSQWDSNPQPLLKKTLNHLAKLANWLCCVVSIYLYGAFGCMFLSCHVRVSKWISTL